MTSPISPNNKNRKPGLTAKGDQRQYVQHCYHDRSEDSIDIVTTSDENTLRLYREDSVGGPFPLKLQIVLKVTEKLGQQHIISWLPHGRSFMIHRPREFEDEVMGKFFKQTKLTSFRRQLNLYDFQRITHGRDAGSYYHELFLRGRPLLAKRMVRRKVKGTKIRASSSPDDEPNFYTMPSMPHLSDYAGNPLASRGMVNHDPSMLGMGGNLSSLSNLQGGSNGHLGFPLPGFNRGVLNHHDPHQLRSHHNSLQQQHLGLPAHLQPNPLYSEYFATQAANAANRVLPASYTGIDNLNNYTGAFASSALQRNNLAASLTMADNERLAAEGRFNPTHHSSLLNQRDMLLDSMAMRNIQNHVGPDTRLSQINERLLGASSQFGAGGGNGYPNVPGALTSMLQLPNASSFAGTGLLQSQNGLHVDVMNNAINNTSAAAVLNRHTPFLAQQQQKQQQQQQQHQDQQQQEKDAVYSRLLRPPQNLALMSSLPNQQQEQLAPGVMGTGNVMSQNDSGGATNNLSLMATMASQSQDMKQNKSIKHNFDEEDGDDDDDDDDDGDDDDDDDDESNNSKRSAEKL